MSGSMYFDSIETENETVHLVLDQIEEFSKQNSKQIYVLNSPLAEKKYEYEYNEAIVILIPDYKIIFLNVGSNEEAFEDFYSDFLEDLGNISDKYDYRDILGRRRQWGTDLFATAKWNSGDSIQTVLSDFILKDEDQKRKIDLLISLLIGSINSVDRVGKELPTSILDKVKRKIILFDGDQTQFIFKKINKKRVIIQGLAGTGKTELLLHKLKELYTEKGTENRVVFTCHNRSLANKLKSRVPEFFNFMKVEEQIEWDKRLWVMHSWGSRTDLSNVGLYSLICKTYGAIFWSAGQTSFEYACKMALQQLNSMPDFEPCFDYILIDESQDFYESFFQLCEKVTTKTVYVSGDIFQNIFRDTLPEVEADFLLNKCYRTDSKTLMFAHALGMGILERPVLRWLTDDEWAACGYEIDTNGQTYSLSRNLLRRFEDIRKEDVPSIEILRTPSYDCREIVIDAIKNIKANHPTVGPEDIAIIFVDAVNSNYDMLDDISIMISNEFGWRTNKIYKTKVNIKESVFISNKNNVKGLEFPFVICIANYKISDNINARNTLYMALTRSFITTNLIISENANTDLLPILENGLNSINENDAIVVNKPKESDILDRTALLRRTEEHFKSQREIVSEIFVELKIPKKNQEKFRQLVSLICEDSVDKQEIKQLILQNKDSVK
ncbi:DEAD/DEAH box helicase [Paenibacillus sp. KN14-4R]|uniref:DEAD/DEAH box helicase n=1 Tax=Paenibacillus sp. KN14-4R TaxID=3445773 RepID=UPI003F9F643A